MQWRQLKARRLGFAAALSAAVAATALAFLPAAIGSGTNDYKNGLSAFVVATNRGPLPACSERSTCTSANGVSHFIYVANANRLTNRNGATNRATVPNAFVVSSVDETILVNGVETSLGFAITPPPDPYILGWSGHWPSTVTCQGQPGAFFPPCNVVGSPAVVPGEKTAITYANWVHASDEPNGTYVFKFTVHGTLNGNPVDLTTYSPPILMTS